MTSLEMLSPHINWSVYRTMRTDRRLVRRQSTAVSQDNEKKKTDPRISL